MTVLSDQNTYEKLSTDPSPKYKRKLVDILKRLKTEDKIHESQYRLLYPTAENTPRLYCTTKTHKEGNPPGNPIRSIVDYTGSIGYQMSKALAEILAPMVGKSEHHVVSSKSLTAEMMGVYIADGEIFNSHDVVSVIINQHPHREMS